MAFLQRLAKVALMLCMSVQLAMAAQPAPKQTWPLEQGMHEYSVTNGKLLLAVGTWQDTTTFKRVYHFFFVLTGQKDWNEVPVVLKPDDLDFAPDSASGGDVTREDWISVVDGEKFYFVRASTRADKGWNDKGEIKATWFQFIEAPDNEPDGPPYALKPVFTRQYPASSKNNVETVLRKESALKPAK